jgi:uncharacterized iron-regulated membrane protein
VGLFLAAVLLTIAAAGLASVAIEPGVVFASSNRRAGLLVIGPLIALVAGVFTLVRGFRAIGPWLAHRSTPLELRRQERAADLHAQPLWPLLTFGFLALAGLAVLTFVFSLYTDRTISLTGRLLQVEILGFLALLTLGCLGLAVQKLYHRRFYAAPDPRAANPPRP